MIDSETTIVIASSALLGAVLLAGLAAWCWRGWLDFKRQELASSDRSHSHTGAPSTSSRIEVADLKERVRRLEAIAAGVDL